MLEQLGIRKGQPFRPDDRQGKILTEALTVGEAKAKANDFAKRLPKAHDVDGSRWHFSTTAKWDQRTEFASELHGAGASTTCPTSPRTHPPMPSGR